MIFMQQWWRDLADIYDNYFTEVFYIILTNKYISIYKYISFF